MSPNPSTHILLSTFLLTLTLIPSFSQDLLFSFPEEEEAGFQEEESPLREGGLVWPQYFCLDGDTDSFVAFDSDVFQFGTSDFTVSIWFKTSEDELPVFDIVGNRFTSDNSSFFQIRMTGSDFPMGQVVVVVDEDDQGTNYADLFSARTDLNDGNWHTITVVRDDIILNLYIDGVLDSQRITGGVANINSDHEVKIGQSLNPNVNDDFAPKACYKDFRVYYTALSAEEIATFSANSA